MASRVNASPVISLDQVQFLLGTGVEYTIASLVKRLQDDFGLNFHEADSIVWRGAGTHWTICQSTGKITVLHDNR